MRYCRRCGSPIGNDSSNFCHNCGAARSGAPAQPYPPAYFAPHMPPGRPAPASAPPGLSRREFAGGYSANGKMCVAAAILCYVSAGATILLSLTEILGFTFYSLLDGAAVLTLGLLIHLLKSRVAAVLLLAYGVFNLIYSMIALKLVGGWLLIVAGVLAVVGAFGCAREWEAYRARTAGSAYDMRMFYE